MTHNKPETYPRLATPVAFVEPDDLLRAVEAVVRLQRDHGDRSDRKRARLKYLIADKGEDWTKSAFEGYFGGPLAVPRAMPRSGSPITWVGTIRATASSISAIPVERADRRRRRTAPAPQSARDPRALRLRPDPDAEPGHHPERDRARDRDAIERELRDHGVTRASDITPVGDGPWPARRCRPAAWR